MAIKIKIGFKNKHPGEFALTRFLPLLCPQKLLYIMSILLYTFIQLFNRLKTKNPTRKEVPEVYASTCKDTAVSTSPEDESYYRLTATEDRSQPRPTAKGDRSKPRLPAQSDRYKPRPLANSDTNKPRPPAEDDRNKPRPFAAEGRERSGRMEELYNVQSFV